MIASIPLALTPTPPSAPDGRQNAATCRNRAEQLPAVPTSARPLHSFDARHSGAKGARAGRRGIKKWTARFDTFRMVNAVFGRSTAVVQSGSLGSFAVPPKSTPQNPTGKMRGEENSVVNFHSAFPPEAPVDITVKYRVAPFSHTSSVLAGRCTAVSSRRPRSLGFAFPSPGVFSEGHRSHPFVHHLHEPG